VDEIARRRLLQPDGCGTACLRYRRHHFSPSEQGCQLYLAGVESSGTIDLEIMKIRRKNNSRAGERDDAAAEFSIADHLSAQRDIETRAYSIWQKERNRASALECWLRAERDVIDEFCAAYAQRFRA
jgi:hypothetical protein